MTSSHLNELLTIIEHLRGDRHKLALVLGDFGAGKTRLLQEAARAAGGVYLNLNLALSERLLTRPRSDYKNGVAVPQMIDELCDEAAPGSRPLFVDNVELLFSPDLGKINPVDTFSRVARQRVVVLALPARRQGAEAEYSHTGRADHLRMHLGAFPVVELKAS